jgi:hypothetical protein
MSRHPFLATVDYLIICFILKFLFCNRTAPRTPLLSPNTTSISPCTHFCEKLRARGAQRENSRKIPQKSNILRFRTKFAYAWEAGVDSGQKVGGQPKSVRTPSLTVSPGICLGYQGSSGHMLVSIGYQGFYHPSLVSLIFSRVPWVAYKLLRSP